MKKRLRLSASYDANSPSRVSKNPFHNIERALQQLGSINNKDWNPKNPIIIHKPVISRDSNSNKPNLNSNEIRIQTALTELKRMFTICQSCGRRTLNDELINHVCYICHNQKELKFVEKELKESKTDQQLGELITRLGELETQIKTLENKQQELSSKDYLSTVIEEISDSVRDSISTNLKQLKDKEPLDSFHTVYSSNNPPPPPPPGTISVSTHIPTSSTDISHLNFAKLSLDELTSFSPQILHSLSLDQRNKYTSRLKELKELEKMSSTEREAYLQAKETSLQQHTDRQSVISSLENLSNPLFKKMKEQADKTILAGKGTLGFFAEKTVFVYCHNCNNTNQVIEGSEAVCKVCHSSLNSR
jgi:hypothetical protein